MWLYCMFKCKLMVFSIHKEYNLKIKFTCLFYYLKQIFNAYI